LDESNEVSALDVGQSLHLSAEISQLRRRELERMVTEDRIRPPPESELVWQFFGGRTDGFFVDIGANDPQRGSQTWMLEERGWRGILIEPQARLCERLRQARPKSQIFQVACGAPDAPPEMTFHTAVTPGHSGLVKNLVDATTTYIGTEKVKVMTLDAILAQAGNPIVDFITMDVEGTQFDVLRGFSLQRHRPKLLLVEDHLYDLNAHRYVGRQGYRLARRTGLNSWYVPDESSFTPATFGERFRLWKKVWANTPFRQLRLFLERQRAERK
jgi:FkbM family methyltransferase